MMPGDLYGYVAQRGDYYLADDRWWPYAWWDRDKWSCWTCVFDTETNARRYGTPVPVFMEPERDSPNLHPMLHLRNPADWLPLDKWPPRHR